MPQSAVDCSSPRKCFIAVVPVALAVLSFLLPALYFICGFCAALLQSDPVYTPTFTNPRYSLVNNTGSAYFYPFEYTDSSTVLNHTTDEQFAYVAPYPTSLSMSSCQYTVYTSVDTDAQGYTFTWSTSNQGWAAEAGETAHFYAPQCGWLNVYRASFIALAILWIPLVVCILGSWAVSQPPSSISRPASAQPEAVPEAELVSPQLEPWRAADWVAAARPALPTPRRPLLTFFSTLQLQRPSSPPPSTPTPPHSTTPMPLMLRFWMAASVLILMTLLLSVLSLVSGWVWATSSGLPNAQWMPMLPVLTAIQGVQWLVIGASRYWTYRDLQQRLAERTQADPNMKIPNLWTCCGII